MATKKEEYFKWEKKVEQPAAGTDTIGTIDEFEQELINSGARLYKLTSWESAITNGHSTTPDDFLTYARDHCGISVEVENTGVGKRRYIIFTLKDIRMVRLQE